MPTYAVMKRFGPSPMSVGGGDDLAKVPRAAYESLS
jgi:hypothetical protein